MVGGDVYVGLRRFFGLGRGVVSCRRVGYRFIVELGGDVVDAGRVRGFGAVGRAYGYALSV